MATRIVNIEKASTCIILSARLILLDRITKCVVVWLSLCWLSLGVKIKFSLLSSCRVQVVLFVQARKCPISPWTAAFNLLYSGVARYVLCLLSRQVGTELSVFLFFEVGHSCCNRNPLLKI